MSMIKIVTHIVLLAASLAVIGPAAAQSFEYANVLNSKHLVTIQMTPALVASGDRASDARFCKTVDGFVCVNSDWFSVAFPSGNAALPERWEQGGREYRLVGREKLVLLGVRRDVLHIESVHKGQKYRYLYSREHGLVGFSAEIDGQPVTFMSQRAIGFGALRK